MPRYVFLLHDAVDGYDTADEEAIAAEFRAHEEFMAAVAAAGAEVVGGEALESPTMTTTVHRGDGEPLVTDGPFADTKEALGGFHVIDAPDLDVALRLARLCPAAHVEVRPVMAMPEEVAGQAGG